jgi:hypothetical protein
MTLDIIYNLMFTFLSFPFSQLHFQECVLPPIFPAITIQAMIYGNFNNNSGSGVLFSRDPVTGATGVHG